MEEQAAQRNKQKKKVISNNSVPHQEKIRQEKSLESPLTRVKDADCWV